MSETTEPVPLSVVILARNEACNMARCVTSVAWCDDVVVVDDGSTDETVSLAQAAGARVVQNRFESFARQRNWALENAGLKHQWVLMLDADEASTDSFRNEIIGSIGSANESAAAFRTCRKTMLGDRWLKHADEFPCWIMRVVHRGKARFEDSGHGEVPIPPVDGVMGTIREPFLHYPFSHGISDWLSRHIRYAEREAALELQQARRVRFGDLASLDAGRRRRAIRDFSRKLPMRQSLRFFYQFVVCRGFLDGRHGFIFSLLKAIYEGMIVAKRWELSAARTDSAGVKSPRDLPLEAATTQREFMEPL